MLAELKKFLLRGNVVDLAVAVVIGVAFGAVVTAFVDNIITPFIAAIFGEPDVSEVLAIELREGAELRIGAFFQAVLDFVVIGCALFFVVQAFSKLQERRTSVLDEDAPPPPDDVVLLTEIRDLLRARN